MHESTPAWGDGGHVEELVGKGEVAGEKVLEEGIVGENGGNGRGGGRQGGGRRGRKGGR